MLDQINKLDYIHTLCVDNEVVRNVVLKSSMLKTKKVPCFLVIYPDGSIYQYLGEELNVFLHKIMEIENQKNQPKVIEKSSVRNVVDNIPEFTEEPIEENQMEERMKNMTSTVSSNSSKSKKTDIGEVVNYKKEKQTKIIPQEKLDNKTIQKGDGHSSMGKSSLRNDNKKKDDFNIIEDIEDTNNSNLISFENEEMKTGTKKITDMKTLMNDMMSQRDKHLESMKN